jgi:hypothetical protein
MHLLVSNAKIPLARHEQQGFDATGCSNDDLRSDCILAYEGHNLCFNN